MTQDAAEGRAVRWGTPTALFALALLVRAGPWREVLGSGRVVPVGNDAFYHLRRIVFYVFRYPASLAFDPYLSFPHGAKPIWTPWFDSGIAALLRPFVPPLERGGQQAVESWAVWVPPLLGALTVVAIWWLARRQGGSVAGLVAGAALCLLSGHFWYSQLGFLDHHVAVALLATLLLGAALALVRAHQDGSRARIGAWAAAVGALAAACLLIWPGSLLHVVLVELGLLGVLLGQRDVARARGLAAALAAGNALGFGLIAPAGLASRWPQWGAFSPVVLSDFQPWLFATGCVINAGCAILWGRPALGATRMRRLLVFAALAAVAGLASALLFSGLIAGAGDAWRWLAKRETFQSRVSESSPLFSDGGHFSTAVAMERLSPFVFALPFAAAWLCWRARRRQDFATTALIALWSLGLLLVTLEQKRFFNTASVGLALVLGLAFAALWRGQWAQSRPRRWRAVLVLALAACLLPTAKGYVRFARNEWLAWRGEPLEVTGMFGESLAEMETATWIRTHTPPTSGWLDADARPEYGVLAPWPLGHVIEYVGRRPTVVDNFGDDLGEEGFAFAERYYQSLESDVADEAMQRGVRYVVIQRSSGFLSRPPGPGSVAHSLFRLDGSARLGGTGPAIGALVHHRLVFESAGLRFTDPKAEPVYKVFELVAGAVISGRAAPGSEIVLRLPVVTNRGRRFSYVTRAVADAAGTYRVRVPYANGDTGTYANDDTGSGCRVAPRYRLTCGDEIRTVAVSEAAVRRGATVQGPSICLGRS